MMLQDLRTITTYIYPMGVLQPELPEPTILPQVWPMIVIDLKVCFYTIPLSL